MITATQKIYIKDVAVVLSEVLIGSEYRTLVTRRSILGGKIYDKIIDVNIGRIMAYYHKQQEVLIQDHFPELSDEDRDFILLGLRYDDNGDLIT